MVDLLPLVEVVGWLFVTKRQRMDARRYREERRSGVRVMSHDEREAAKAAWIEVCVAKVLWSAIGVGVLAILLIVFRLVHTA